MGDDMRIEDGTDVESIETTGSRPSKRSGLTANLVDQLRRNGMTDVEIARTYDVPQSTITHFKNKLGDRRYMTPREQAVALFPWPDMAPGFKESPFYKRITEHLMYILWLRDDAKEFPPLSSGQIKRLSSFYEKLIRFGNVVVFDPRIPPKPGSSKGGWDFVPKLDSDRDLIIRVNEYVTVTDTVRDVMRLPDTLPDIG